MTHFLSIGVVVVAFAVAAVANSDAGLLRRQPLDPTPDVVAAVDVYHSGLDELHAGHLEEAASAFRDALRRMPGLTEARLSLGHLLTMPGSSDAVEAAAQYTAALAGLGDDAARVEPDLMAAALTGLGSALTIVGSVESLRQAEGVLRRAVSLADEVGGDASMSRHNLGILLARTGRDAEAAGELQAVLAASGAAPHASALLELGNIAVRAGEDDLSLAYFSAAVEQARLAYQERSVRSSRRDGCGIVVLREAQLLRDALLNLAEVLRDSGQLKAASETLGELLVRSEEYGACAAGGSSAGRDAANLIRHTRFRAHITSRAAFDWEGDVDDHARGARVMWELSSLVASGWQGQPSPGVFYALYLPLSGVELHALALMTARGAPHVSAEVYARALSTQPGVHSAFLSPTRRELRVGFLSYDFREHVSAYMVRGMLRHHAEGGRVAPRCYHIGPLVDGNSSAAHGIRSACGDVVHLLRASDDEAAEAISSDALDILVDLSGHMRGGRLGIPARLPAPLVVNYLGYPGTIGGPWSHFIVVDRVILGGEELGAASEARVVLPHTYQANDYAATQAFANGGGCSDTVRGQLGLPLLDAGVVIAALNAPSKLEPDVWRMWMAILRRTPRSVLWLLAPRVDETAPAGLAEQRLRNEAAANGVSPQRVVFAPRVSRAEHLERVSCADLFIDTCSYCGHTTVADVLWAHVPVIACATPTFQGRVAASLLRAAGADALSVTYSRRSYEDVGVRMIAGPGHRGLLKYASTFLSHVSLRTPAFDSERITHDLDRAYLAMWDAVRAAAHGHVRCSANDERSPRSAHCSIQRMSAIPHLVVNPRGRLLPQSAADLRDMPADHVLAAGSDSPAVLLDAWERRLSNYVQQGANALRSADLDGAKRAADRVLLAYGTHAGAARLLADVAEAAGDYATAMQHLASAKTWAYNGVGNVRGVRDDNAGRAAEQAMKRMAPLALAQLRSELATADDAGGPHASAALLERLGVLAEGDGRQVPLPLAETVKRSLSLRALLDPSFPGPGPAFGQAVALTASGASDDLTSTTRRVRCTTDAANTWRDDAKFRDTQAGPDGCVDADVVRSILRRTRPPWSPRPVLSPSCEPGTEMCANAAVTATAASTDGTAPANEEARGIRHETGFDDSALPPWEVRTCAVVANGPSLLGRSLGREIDAADVVVRMNDARVTGFEPDVGTRTTLRVLFLMRNALLSVPCTAHRNATAARLIAETRARAAREYEGVWLFGIDYAPSAQVIDSMLQVGATVSVEYQPYLEGDSHGAPRCFSLPRELASHRMALLAPSFYEHVLHRWARPLSPPSTGLLALVAAFHICGGGVRTYGFGSGSLAEGNPSVEGRWGHYHDGGDELWAMKPGVHDVQAERQLRWALHDLGAIEDVTREGGGGEGRGDAVEAARRGPGV
uniref:O-GlcNAc transferase C-terminal domain-containing protein n=1 Tax=Bicosoecida sp. CB-2014 TaxID=1486930 RepID=A0A7S1CIU5_9STRA|mmetsp:Transcript_28532/g.98508  ORF Transcript_28532/g.98508 Transcript_28532/m.98508 type:complete len:1418 (+) Transcript_28532:313-4566(+)